MYDLDIQIFEKIEIFQENLKSLGKLKKVTKTLKAQLEDISNRLKKDTNFMEKVVKRITSVVGEFRERCRNSLIDFLKILDFDIRKMLKPLVSSRVIEENVQFPKLNSEREILESTLENEFEPEGSDENSKLTAHVNMLVSTLEKIAKELLQVLHETNRKYYETVNPSQLYSEAPTPLAMPLPEYFTFENIENHQVGLPKQMFSLQSVENLKIKVEKLLRRGSLTNQEAKNMLEKIDKMILSKDNDLEQVLKDVPNSKREEIVFQIIHSSVRAESNCSPRTERKEILIKTKKPELEDTTIEKKSMSTINKNTNKRIFKPRSSVPVVTRERKTSLPKNHSSIKVKKDDIRARTPTKSAKKKPKNLKSRVNKSFLL